MDIEPVVLSQDELRTLRSLAAATGDAVQFSPELVEDEGYEAKIRAIVREEIASLAGKALRRTQDQDMTRSPDRNMMVEIANREMAQFWGEVLSEYGGEEKDE